MRSLQQSVDLEGDPVSPWDRHLWVGDLLISGLYVYVVVRGEEGVGEPTMCHGFIYRMRRRVPHEWVTEYRVWENWSHRIVR